MPLGIGGPGGGLRTIFRPLAIAASGLRAQRLRIETASENIANAETTRTAAGGPYRRQVVTLEAGYEQPTLPLAITPGELPDPDAVPEGATGVKVSGVVEDTSQGPLVYDPGHPDADAAGYVRYPNVSVTDEMVNMLESRRMYEANATVFEAVKSMLRRAIDI